MFVGESETEVPVARAGAPRRRVGRRTAPQAGDRVELRLEGDRVAVLAEGGVRIARLSKAAAQKWRLRLGNIVEARVLAMVVRTAEQESDPAHRPLKVPRWELPILELRTFQPG